MVASSARMRVGADGVLHLGPPEYGLEVDVAAISEDGKRALTVREVDRASVWNATTGTCLTEIVVRSPLEGRDGFRTFIEAAALDRDGAYVLLGLNDRTAVIHRTDDGARLAVLHPPGEAPDWGVIRAVAFARALDGAYALVGFSGRRVGVWTADGTRLVAFVGATAGDRLVKQPFVRDTLVSTVALSADGTTVFAGASDTTAAAFDLQSGAVIFEATKHAENVLAAFGDDKRTGWVTSTGRVWIDGREALAADAHLREATVAGERVLAAGHDESVALWNLADGTRSELFGGCEDTELGWPEDASTLAIDGTGLMYPEGPHRLVLHGEKRVAITRGDRITSAARSPSGPHLAIMGWRDALELYDARTGDIAHLLDCPGGVGCFAFSPDGARVACGEVGNGGGLFPRAVFVYETATGRMDARFDLHEWQVRQVAFSASGKRLVSVADDAVVIGDSTFRVPLSRTCGEVRFLGEDLLVVDEGLVRIFSGPHEQVRFEAPVGFMTRWALSKDQRHLLVPVQHAVARFELETGELVSIVEAPIPRPALVPGAMLWRTLRGAFIHQTDGPRGWRQSVERHGDRIVARTETGVGIFELTDTSVALRQTVPFDGRLRASRIVDGELVLVSHEGRIHRYAI